MENEKKNWNFNEILEKFKKNFKKMIIFWQVSREQKILSFFSIKSSKLKNLDALSLKLSLSYGPKILIFRNNFTFRIAIVYKFGQNLNPQQVSL